MSDIDLRELSRIFASASRRTHTVAAAIAKETGVAIRDRAKEKLGTYQEASGGFPEWAQLAESTQDQRARAGYTPDEPLLRSGELRDSITTRADGNGSITGTALDIGLWMETGTEKVPPRPYLGPAAEEEVHKIGIIAAPLIKTLFRG
ncbi:TPA: hypothetical protein ACQ431_003012 [Citrobacter murliniae]